MSIKILTPATRLAVYSLVLYLSFHALQAQTTSMMSSTGSAGDTRTIVHPLTDSTMLCFFNGDNRLVIASPFDSITPTYYFLNDYEIHDIKVWNDLAFFCGKGGGSQPLLGYINCTDIANISTPELVTLNLNDLNNLVSPPLDFTRMCIYDDGHLLQLFAIGTDNTSEQYIVKFSSFADDLYNWDYTVVHDDPGASSSGVTITYSDITTTDNYVVATGVSNYGFMCFRAFPNGDLTESVAHYVGCLVDNGSLQSPLNNRFAACPLPANQLAFASLYLQTLPTNMSTNIADGYQILIFDISNYHSTVSQQLARDSQLDLQYSIGQYYFPSTRTVALSGVDDMAYDAYGNRLLILETGDNVLDTMSTINVADLNSLSLQTYYLQGFDWFSLAATPFTLNSNFANNFSAAGRSQQPKHWGYWVSQTHGSATCLGKVDYVLFTRSNTAFKTEYLPLQFSDGFAPATFPFVLEPVIKQNDSICP
ncbi:MAG: hypothetical protein IJV22_03050 [Bacteroidales bacterium]|nr:hypothetical protein [Bacteroidales bacterium]